MKMKLSRFKFVVMAFAAVAAWDIARPGVKSSRRDNAYGPGGLCA